MVLLPPANEVLGKATFSEACANHSVHGWRAWHGCARFNDFGCFSPSGFSHFHCNAMRKAIKLHKNLHTNQQNELTKEAHVWCVVGRGGIRVGEMASEADGTHHTGMHSCCYYFQLIMTIHLLIPCVPLFP